MAKLSKREQCLIAAMKEIGMIHADTLYKIFKHAAMEFYKEDEHQTAAAAGWRDGRFEGRMR